MLFYEVEGPCENEAIRCPSMPVSQADIAIVCVLVCGQNYSFPALQPKTSQKPGPTSLTIVCCPSQP